MRRALLYSAGFHAGVLALLYVGLPSSPRIVDVPPPIPVDVVTVDELTRPEPLPDAPPEKPKLEEPRQDDPSRSAADAEPRRACRRESPL